MRWIVVAALSVALLAGCAAGGKKQTRGDKIDYHYRMGMAHLEDGKLQAALVSLRSARELDDKDTRVLFALGHVLFTMGEFESAREQMERIIKLDPENGEATNYLGNIYEQLGRTDEAIAMFKKATELEHYLTPHFSFHNLGRIYLRQGDMKEAERMFRSALNRVPEYYPARADLGKLYLDTGQWLRAVEEWRLFLDLMPNLYEARYYLGRAYIGVENIQKARQALTEFIDKAPPDHPLLPDARELLENLAADE